MAPGNVVAIVRSTKDMAKSLVEVQAKFPSFPVGSVLDCWLIGDEVCKRLPLSSITVYANRAARLHSTKGEQ